MEKRRFSNTLCAIKSDAIGTIRSISSRLPKGRNFLNGHINRFMEVPTMVDGVKCHITAISYNKKDDSYKLETDLTDDDMRYRRIDISDISIDALCDLADRICDNDVTMEYYKI